MTDSPAAATAVQVTRAGFERRQRELAALKTERRPEVARRLQRARLFLDSTANEGPVAVAEGELALIDARIAALEAQLADAEIVGEDAAPTRVGLGVPVRVRHEDGTEETLTVVGPLEVNPAVGLVASASPMGQALLGKAAGANVSVGEGADALSLTVVRIGTPAEDDAEPAAETERP